MLSSWSSVTQLTSMLCRAAHSDASGSLQTTALAKALAASGSGNGDSLPQVASTGGNGGGNGGSEPVATPRTPTRDGEDGSLASIMTAQRDRFRQRCGNPPSASPLFLGKVTRLLGTLACRVTP